MLVHVKIPPIDVQLTGQGTALVIESLRKTYGQVEVSDDDEAVPVESTDWYKSISQQVTQADLLFSYRDNAGMTLDVLSQKSGIPKSNLSEMENNKRPIGPKIAKKLAKVFEIDYRCFFLD